MGALFGDIAKIGQSTEPDMHGKLVVFDPKVFRDTNSLLSDWSSNRNDWKNTFNNWKTSFDAATPEFKSNINRENDYLGYLRDGGFEKTLAGIRASEGQADQKERQNDLDFAGGSVDRAKLADNSGPGGSSADFARRLRAGSRIDAEFAGRAPARERADLGTVTNVKLGTMGRMNANLDALVNRQLTPQQLSDSELQNMVHSLAGIQGVRMGSASPVFWRQTGLGEQLAAPLDDALSIAASFYGGKANSAPDNNPQLGTGEAPQTQSASSFGTGQGANEGTGEGGTSAWGNANTYNYSRPAANQGFDTPSWMGSVA